MIEVEEFQMRVKTGLVKKSEGLLYQKASQANQISAHVCHGHIIVVEASHIG